ncbi:B-cell antigen receptor complex-associated protein beta chain [Centroberyx affinis]|uniref:B-cell antigen receptor complex-associated protein beta chain n=1 Tax=Centroberyx affinis TaxID=166261 RepID=UPI003A5BF996
MTVEECQLVYICIRNILLLFFTMRWLLIGCYGLALVNLSVARQVSQKPRFYGVKTNQKAVIIYCVGGEKNKTAHVEWFRATDYKVKREARTPVYAGERIHIYNRTEGNSNASITLKKLRITDSAVYYCKLNNIWGPGTELQVARVTSLEAVVYRSQLKDGLMILQGLLLAICVAAPLLRNHLMMKKRDSIYEEPETDHIYEGLGIETCGGDLYEEISAYAQAGEAEVPWEQD